MVTIILLVLCFGVADFGIFMYRYVQAANCVREAARRAVVRADNAASPPYCVDAGLSPTLNPSSYQTLPAGEEVEASVDATFPWVGIGYLIPGLGSTYQITVTTSMRMEGQVVT